MPASLVRRLSRWWFPAVLCPLGLVAMYAAGEITLRVYDSCTSQITHGDCYDRGPVCKSWTVHHELKPNYRTGADRTTDDWNADFQTNAHGLRGTHLVVPKPPGTIRILCLGDEHTLVPHLPERETWVAQLQEGLRVRTRTEVEVWNAGVPDYCPLLALLALKYRWLALQPDLVIMTVEMSDVADDYAVRRQLRLGPGGEACGCPHPGLLVPHTAVTAQQAPWQDWFLVPQWTRRRVARLWAERWLPEPVRDLGSAGGRYRWGENHPPDWAPLIEQAFAPLAELKRLCDAAPCGLVVGMVPLPWQVSPHACPNRSLRERYGVGPQSTWSNRRPFETVAAACATLRIPFVDLSGALAAQDRPEQFFETSRVALSPAGQQAYAELLAGWCWQQVWAPWEPRGGPPHSPPAEIEPAGFRR